MLPWELQLLSKESLLTSFRLAGGWFLFLPHSPVALSTESLLLSLRFLLWRCGVGMGGGGQAQTHLPF